MSETGLAGERRTNRVLGALPPNVVVPLGVILLILLAGFFAPLPYGPSEHGPPPMTPPSADNWFGTDLSGFDVFSRTVVAARLDLPLALAGTVFALLVGVPGGLVASAGGPWGERLMRGLDAFQAFPLVILAVAIVSLGGDNLAYVVLAIGLINIPRFMRIVRSQAMSLRQRRFVEAATAMGASRWRIMARHLLPNVSGAILVQASLSTAHAIIVIAALGFLGIGITPPDPSWGFMIRGGARSIPSGDWWVAFFPGLAVFVTVMSFNWMADELERLFQRRSI